VPEISRAAVPERAAAPPAAAAPRPAGRFCRSPRDGGGNCPV